MEIFPSIFAQIVEVSKVMPGLNILDELSVSNEIKQEKFRSMKR